MSAWIALLLLQGGPSIDELLRRLDDDGIEARTEAADQLLRRGMAAVPALEKARDAARGELRERLTELLGRVRDRERLAVVLKPATRFTMEVDRIPLTELLRRLEAPTPFALAPETRDRPVTLSLRDVPYWRAVEEICRAAGDVRLEPGDRALRLVPGAPNAVPRALFDPFVVRLEGVSSVEEAELGTPDRSSSSSLRLRTCWELGTRPSRIRAVLERFEEDGGRDVLREAAQAPEAAAVPPEGAIGQLLHLSFPGVPSADAKQASIRAAVELAFVLRWNELQFTAPWAEGQTRECPEFGAKILQAESGAGQLSVSFQVYPRSKAVAADVASVLTLKDEAGKLLNPVLLNPVRNGNAVVVSAVFMHAGERPLRELRLSLPSDVHTERLIADFPEVPLR